MLRPLIRPALVSDQQQLVKLRHGLWPEGSLTEHADELAAILACELPASMPLTILVAEVGEKELAGFLEVGLRPYAEGCDPSRPVGYVEGWYVAERHRRQGIGSALLAAAEDWARSQNCREMASDAQLDNHASQRTHVALGFEEVEQHGMLSKAIVKDGR